MLALLTCVLCARPGPPVCRGCAAAQRPAPSLATPLGLDRCSALLDYASCRELVTSFKNGGRRDLVRWMASGMVALAEPPSDAVVTWAPTASRRRHARGYDQAELLARAVARRWGVRCDGLLRRAPGPPQSGRSATERRQHPGFVTPRGCPPAVVVVDDVVTTGATLTAAAAALRAAGCRSVTAVVAARSGGRARL